MPRFIYTAKPQPNQLQRGNIEAESEADAINKLSKLGLFPISMEQNDLASNSAGVLLFSKVSSRDIVLFTRQLVTLVESGVNIITALNIVSKQTSNKTLSQVLIDVTNKIKEGKSLSASLDSYPRIFSKLYISMIYTGETGGHLNEALKRLADFLEKEEEFINNIRSALMYPSFVFAVGVLTVTVLLGFVIPRLVVMFEDMGQTLPLPTRMLIGISSVFHNYWWLIILLIAIPLFLLNRYSKTEAGSLRCDRLKLKAVILGPIILKAEIARLMRTLSLLLSSGLAIVYSLDTASSVLENEVLKREARGFKKQISEGSSFSDCLKESKLVPAFVINIVNVGEESGTLEKSLLRIAQDYEKDVDSALKTLTRLLEPIIILVMGLVVGFIVLSMLLPIFQINLIVK